MMILTWTRLGVTACLLICGSVASAQYGGGYAPTRYYPATPTISGYHNLLLPSTFSGIDPYNAYLRPQRRLNDFYQAEQGQLQAQRLELNRVENNLQIASEEIKDLTDQRKQHQYGGAPLRPNRPLVSPRGLRSNGTGSTFLNTSHYFPGR